MSENEMIIQMSNRLETMAQKMEDMEQSIQLLKFSEKRMQWPSALLNKDVFNCKEAALYMGLSVDYLYDLCNRGIFQAYKPSNGKLYFKKVDVYSWLLSKLRNGVSSQVTEQEKLAIFHTERG